MGAPTDEQIEEEIAWCLANRWSEDRIVKHLATFERMTDEELAAIGVFPPPPKPDPSVSKATNPARWSPSMAPSYARAVSRSGRPAPRAGRPRRACPERVEGLQSGGSGSTTGWPQSG